MSFPSLNAGDLSLCAEMMSKIPLDEMTRSKHRSFGDGSLSVTDRIDPLSQKDGELNASLDVSGISLKIGVTFIKAVS